MPSPAKISTIGSGLSNFFANTPNTTTEQSSSNATNWIECTAASAIPFSKHTRVPIVRKRVIR